MIEPLFPAPRGMAWETQGREETELLKVRKHISCLSGYLHNEYTSTQ